MAHGCFRCQKPCDCLAGDQDVTACVHCDDDPPDWVDDDEDLEGDDEIEDDEDEDVEDFS